MWHSKVEPAYLKCGGYRASGPALVKCKCHHRVTYNKIQKMNERTTSGNFQELLRNIPVS